jgi:hypothetical protein
MIQWAETDVVKVYTATINDHYCRITETRESEDKYKRHFHYEIIKPNGEIRIGYDMSDCPCGLKTKIEMDIQG